LTVEKKKNASFPLNLTPGERGLSSAGLIGPKCLVIEMFFEIELPQFLFFQTITSGKILKRHSTAMKQ